MIQRVTDHDQEQIDRELMHELWDLSRQLPVVPANVHLTLGRATGTILRLLDEVKRLRRKCGMDLPDWTHDAHGCWNLHVGRVHMWLCPRPGYCDRGRWSCGVDGIATLDEADCFPRYFMDLERAKSEMEDWLRYRLDARAKGSTVNLY